MIQFDEKFRQDISMMLFPRGLQSRFAIPRGLRRTVIELVVKPRAYVLPISGAEGTADALTAAIRGSDQG
jgi:hypothetical protein